LGIPEENSAHHKMP